MLENQWVLLFKNSWNGPYWVVEQINQGPYQLEELDGTKLLRRHAASQVKRFYPRGVVLEEMDHEEENEGTEEEFEEEDE